MGDDGTGELLHHRSGKAFPGQMTPNGGRRINDCFAWPFRTCGLNATLGALTFQMRWACVVTYHFQIQDEGVFKLDAAQRSRLQKAGIDRALIAVEPGDCLFMVGGKLVHGSVKGTDVPRFMTYAQWAKAK
jgi:hypothetical protein